VRCVDGSTFPAPGVSVTLMSDGRHSRALHVTFLSMRRHVDFCRTATAVCRA